MATAGLFMISGVAMAQQNSTPAPGTAQPGSSSGYTNSGMSSSNGAAVAPNGGLKSGIGTTVVNPNTPTGGNTVPNGGTGSGSK
jgi:hypothetical protein